MVCDLLCVVSLDQVIFFVSSRLIQLRMVCELLCVVSLDQGSNLEWSVIFFVSSRLIKVPT